MLSGPGLAGRAALERGLALALALLGLGGCSSELFVLSRTPASLEIAATYKRADQDIADVAQAHCAAARQDAVQVRLREGVAMPDGLGFGRALLFHCR